MQALIAQVLLEMASYRDQIRGRTEGLQIMAIEVAKALEAASLSFEGKDAAFNECLRQLDVAQGAMGQAMRALADGMDERDATRLRKVAQRRVFGL